MLFGKSVEVAVLCSSADYVYFGIALSRILLKVGNRNAITVGEAYVCGVKEVAGVYGRGTAASHKIVPNRSRHAFRCGKRLVVYVKDFGISAFASHIHDIVPARIGAKLVTEALYSRRRPRWNIPRGATFRR